MDTWLEMAYEDRYGGISDDVLDSNGDNFWCGFCGFCHYGDCNESN